MRYELIDYEWTAIKPFLPNKPRGVPRVNDRRVLNGIFWVLLRSTVARSAGRLWPVHHLLQSLRTLATGGRLGWAYEALAATHDAAVQMIDTSIVRVHQHAACIIRNKRQIRHLVTTGESQRAGSGQRRNHRRRSENGLTLVAVIFSILLELQAQPGWP